MECSEAFRLQVVREVETGKFVSAYAAAQAYGIGGASTVQQWLPRYGKSHLLGRLIRVEKPEEVSERRRLRQRVRELERALSDAHLDLKLQEAYMRLACRSAGIEDVEELKN